MHKKTVYYVLVFFIYFIVTDEVISQPKIYLVRHCEKYENWQSDLLDFQPLNNEGIESSKRLERYFYNIDLNAIYSSPVTRTLQTAYFISKNKSLNIIAEDACNDTSLLNSFIEKINVNYKYNESILVISHSNIIPYFLIKLGLQPERYNEFGIIEKNNWLLTDYYGYIFIIEQKSDSSKINRVKY